MDSATINAMKNLMTSMVGNMNTLDIGIVDSLNETNNTLNVTLLRLFQSRYSPYEIGLNVPTVQLYDIPVMRPNCRNFSLIPEYSIGDRVLVAYSKKDSHAQLSADVPQNMDAYTDYAVQNAIVLGTIPKWENLPPVASTVMDTTTTLMHKSESAIRFNTDGTLTIAEQFPNEFIDYFNIRSIDLTKITDKTYPKIVMKNDGEIVISIVHDKGSVDTSGMFPKISNNENTVLAEFKIKADKNKNFSYSLTATGSDDKKYGFTMDNGNLTIDAKEITINAKKVNFKKAS